PPALPCRRSARLAAARDAAERQDGYVRARARRGRQSRHRRSADRRLRARRASARTRLAERLTADVVRDRPHDRLDRPRDRAVRSERDHPSAREVRRRDARGVAPERDLESFAPPISYLTHIQHSALVETILYEQIKQDMQRDAALCR